MDKQLNKSGIEVVQRTAKSTDLMPYCYFAKKWDFIEVTEWTNGEGFDVVISSKRGTQTVNMTYGEFQALQALVAYQE